MKYLVSITGSDETGYAYSINDRFAQRSWATTGSYKSMTEACNEACDALAKLMRTDQTRERKLEESLSA